VNASNVIININKPKNISSQQAVTRVKKILGARKAGHTGTLDPIATGVLLVCMNKATKVSRFLSDLDKEYITGMKLGERTDTYDVTGKIIDKRDCSFLKESDVCEALKSFQGAIKQTPPMYSAIKLHGQPLYKLARKGLSSKIPERSVTVSHIELLRFNLPYLELKISCSKGTYIRTLCDDIGKMLGVGACMTSLERTRVGKFRIEDSALVEDLLSKKEAFYSIDFAISHIKEIILDEDSYQQIKKGVPVPVNNEELHRDQYIKLKSPQNILFGIGRIEKDKIKIERLFDCS
jgi:tRNA pseudouridine55 synthase